MYGSVDHDPVVKYYDDALGIGSPEERAWFVRHAQEGDGPVLDLACGTGRAGLLIAREGLAVTGLDQSAGMLHLFRRKLVHEAPAVRQRIQLVQGSMTSFALPGRFKTVICVDAFFYNLTVDDQMATLRTVYDHLLPGGRLVFNLPNPTCAFITAAEAAAPSAFTTRGRFPIDEGTLLVEQADHDADTLQQTLTTTLRFTVLDAQGQQQSQTTSQWQSRYLYPMEAVHLLYRCGFEVKGLHGDYQGGPVTPTSQLLFHAERRDS